MRRRVWSAILALVMCFSLLPVTAFAAGSDVMGTETAIEAEAVPSLLSVQAGTGKITFKWNAFSGATNYEVFRKVGNGGWTSVKKTTGTSYVDTAITKDTKYAYTVRACVGGSWTKYNTTGLCIVATSSSVQITAPTGLTPTSGADGKSVTLKWTNGANAASVRIDRKTGNGSFATLKSSVTGTSYVDKTTAPGTKYTYRVYSMAADGTTKGGYADVTVTTKIAVATPAAPTKLTATSSTTGKGVTLKWTNGANAASVTICRKVDGGSFATLKSSVTGTSYVDKTTTPGTKYTYRVYSYAADGKTKGGYTDVSVTAKAGTLVKPGVPTGVTATSAANGGSVTLKWTNGANAALVIIYRKTDSGSWKCITESVTGTSYTDATTQPGTKYTYRLYSVEADGTTKSASLDINVTTKNGPAAPTGFTATSAADGGSVTLKWKNGANAASVMVYRMADGGSWSCLKKNVTGTSYVDKTAKPGTKYTYRLFSVAADGTTKSAKVEVEVKTKDAPAPGKPTGVTATAAAGGKSVTLKWKNGQNAASVSIYRKTGNGSWSTLKTGVTAASYKDTTTKPGKTYTYRVYSYAADGKTKGGYVDVTVTTKGVYTMGVDTYSFANFGDSDSAGGHCFGMSITSAGYFNGQLNIRIIGGNANTALYSFSRTTTVTKPICYYQARQGSAANSAIVAGGTYYLSPTDVYDVKADWKAIVNYVKSHAYDNTGLLQIGYRKENEGGHAINFLRYERVNGQDRIYAYDNNFPTQETYFYQDSSGRVWQKPKSTFGGSIDCIALRDIRKYYDRVGSYDATHTLYMTAAAASVQGYDYYPMEGTMFGEEYVMYEIPADQNRVTIIPRKDNATFIYMDQEYSFGEITEHTRGELVLTSAGENSALRGTNFRIYEEGGTSSDAPTGMTATAEPGQITFRWNAVDNAVKYVVCRKTAGGAWEQVASVRETGYVDTDVTAGVTYTYTIRAYVNGKWTGYLNKTGASTTAK